MFGCCSRASVCPLAPKAREDELRIHPVSHQCDSHLGAILVVISFCEEDSRPYRRGQALVPIDTTDSSRRAGGCARAMARFERDIDSLLNEAARRGVIARKELPHLASHLFVRSRERGRSTPSARWSARPVPSRRAPDRQPPIWSHGVPRDSSRWSQASASRWSRPIVPTETFSARAVSSTLSPPKKRSSITLALRASTAAVR